MTTITDVVEGGYVRTHGQWFAIMEIRLVYKHGRLREWFITTEDGIVDMYQAQLYATTTEFELGPPLEPPVWQPPTDPESDPARRTR